MNQVLAYARVSTQEQHLDRQLVALRAFGVQSENIFLDKQSGKDFERPAYQELLGTIKPTDTLVVSSIDSYDQRFLMNRNHPRYWYFRK